MQVIVAEHAGFCFGVRRAIELVTRAVESGGPLTTLGPLIHNPQEVERLSASGVHVASDVKDAIDGRVVMPSHGAPQEALEQARSTGHEIIDATCPYVAKVHRTVRELANAGFQVVVVGDQGHSEVKGILSAAGSGSVAISTPEEAEQREWKGRVGVVAQTTQTADRFAAVVAVIKRTADDVRAVNTICVATRQRQEAIQDVAPEVDVVFVIGGRNSANTNRLRELCDAKGVPTYHIETASEIQDDWLKGMTTAGITAGASTPDWVIAEVKARLEKA